MSPKEISRRVILLIGARSYRGPAFVEAAERLGLSVVQGIDLPQELADYYRPTLPLQFDRPGEAAAQVIAYAKAHPVHTILSVDDGATVIAARACDELDISHNSPEAANAARNKFVMRETLARAGVPGPAFRRVETEVDARALAGEIDYPCVVKPLLLSGSQGVIRANDPAEFVEAFGCTRAIVLTSGSEPAAEGPAHILIEDYIPGLEVAVEGILSGGRLRLLAFFDKPDPLVGPYFEETIYTTPSRLPEAVQREILACAERACAALRLREGPVHAELRYNDDGPWVVEVAGRSIGGLCSRVLRFGTEKTSLEELILRHAMGLEVDDLTREARAGGVMMIPIPAAGILREVQGLREAQAVEGIEEIEISLPLKHACKPLPYGSSYLGFIFARGETPAEVEAALREAHRRLAFVITPEIRLSVG